MPRALNVCPDKEQLETISPMVIIHNIITGIDISRIRVRDAVDLLTLRILLKSLDYNERLIRSNPAYCYKYNHGILSEIGTLFNTIDGGCEMLDNPENYLEKYCAAL
jgi:hypothetical protein